VKLKGLAGHLSGPWNMLFNAIKRGEPYLSEEHREGKRAKSEGKGEKEEKREKKKGKKAKEENARNGASGAT